MRSLFLAFLLSGVFVACSSQKTHDSLDAAIAAAGSNSRDILIIVSKSDECHACSLLEKNILTNPQWKPESLYEVVRIDLTEKLKKEHPELWKSGDTIQTRYGARWFPAIILTDSRGMPYHIGGYDESSPEEVFKLLEGRTKERRHELAAILAKATNGMKARAALHKLKEWGVDTAYHKLKALAMGGSRDPGFAIELVEYWTALGDLKKREEWLRVLETGWPQAWRDTLVRLDVEQIEKNEFEKMEWKAARAKLEPLMAKKPLGIAASRLYAALGEVAYQLRERGPCLGYFSQALEHAPEGKLKTMLTNRLAYLKKNSF